MSHVLSLRYALGGPACLALGIVVLVSTSDLAWLTESGVVGPGAVPGVCGVLLTVLGLVQIGQHFLERRRTLAVPATAGAAEATEVPGAQPAPGIAGQDRQELAETSGDEEPAVPGNTRLVVLAWAGVLGAALALSYLGTLLTVGLLTFYLVKIVSRKRWLTAAIYTASMVVAVYLLFDQMLNIPLPTFALS
ncbi:MAG TPA: tripartite tricarboxylate transporter TctB family protein [Beutenbergiaceae bacterium]|nr:tripartite tricarboxylate transporter TctB family protein [Beutenbergiaceae bacterium]